MHSMNPQVKAFCAIVQQLPAAQLVESEALRDPDQNPAYLKLQELNDIALSIAHFGTSAAKEEFYNLLDAGSAISQHASAAILQHFQPPEEIRERALTLLIAEVKEHGFVD